MESYTFCINQETTLIYSLCSNQQICEYRLNVSIECTVYVLAEETLSKCKVFEEVIN